MDGQRKGVKKRRLGEGKGIEKGAVANRTYLRNPYHNTQSQQEKDYLASKRPALTPGDYTKNIGNAKKSEQSCNFKEECSCDYLKGDCKKAGKV